MSTTQADAAARREVQAVIGAQPAQGRRADWLLEYLHRLDEQWGGLHAEHLAALAEELALPLAQVRAVASHCGQFTVLGEGEQPPALRLTLCSGLPCGLAGAESLRTRLAPLLPADVALTGSACIARCQHAPAALVGQVPVAPATPEAVLNTLLHEAERAPGEMGRAHGVSDAESYDAYRAAGGYQLAAALANGLRDPAQVLQVLEDVRLLGPGGLVAAQWREARAQAAPRRLTVDLAGGEPGAFAARQLLEREPHRFLEGVLLAALGIGADAVAIDLHPSWHDARLLLQDELGKLRANCPFPLPQVELQRGAAAPLCAERAAWALPAVLQLDFATAFALRELLERGADWYTAQGRRKRTGLRSFSVSGRVRSTGVKLAPAGISLRELVEEHCDGMLDGFALYAWMPGGASGGILPAELADVALDTDTLQPHGATLGPGAIVVLGAQDRARDAALASMRFFAEASCGQHAGCAAAVMRAAQLMAAPRWEGALLQKLQQELAGNPDCALARAAATSLRCMHRWFPAETAA